MSTFTFLLRNSSCWHRNSVTTEKLGKWRQTRYAQKQKRVKGKDMFPDRSENMQALQDYTTEESFICRGRLKMDV